MTLPPPDRRVSVHVSNLLPAALAVIGVLLVLSFLSHVRVPLLAVTLAVLLATALNPLARRLERRLPRPLAAILTVFGTVAVLVGLGALAVPPIVAQAALGEPPHRRGRLAAAGDRMGRALPRPERGGSA